MRGPWGHLTYCLNVHPGETWADVMDAVEGPAHAVKQAIAPHEPFGLGLRLSAAAVREGLRKDRLDVFRERLHALGMYVFTINGFPYGQFHETAVKDQVYLPDWGHPARAEYTSGLALFLAQLLPAGCRGSISTVPLGFRAHTQLNQGGQRIQRMADNLVEQVLDLAALEQTTERWVQLALEPEPGCLLETSQDIVDFFQRHLLTSNVATRVSAARTIGREAALELVRRHVGVCIDTCHAAVEFEHAEQAVARLLSAGISIAKLQLSSGLKVCPVSDVAVEALRRFDEPVYLHQVVARSADGGLIRMNDLGEALERFPLIRDNEWRVHFHVPVHVEDYPCFSSTRRELESWLELHARAALCDHVEVETYTWDVLPEKSGSLVESLTEELRWVKGQLLK